MFVGIGKVYAATYFVSPEGSNTSPYDTWEKAANLPETAITAGNTDVGGDGPHIMYIAPGTYSSYMSASDADWANGTIIGTAAHGSIDPAAKGQVIISATAGQHGFISTQAGISVSNISITGTDATHDGIVISGSNFTGTNLYLYDSGRSNFQATSATGLSISKSLITGSTSYSININGTNISGTISYSIIRNSVNKLSGSSAILFNDTGTLNIYNCIVMGAGNYGIYNNSTGTINLANSYVTSGINSATAAVKNASGTVNAINNLFIGNWNGYSIVYGSLTVDTNNIKTLAPLFTAHTMPGMVVLSIDDAPTIDYVESVEPILAYYGAKGTYYFPTASVSAEVLVRLNSLISRGTFSVGGHSYSHSTLSLTGNIYSITKTGSTINIDRAANTITVAPGGTVTGFKTKTLAAIKTELEALGCTIGNYPAGLNYWALGEIMADSGGAQASPYTPQLLIDTSAATGYFKSEIADPKTYLEANLTGYTGKSFATPGGNTSADVETAVKNAGWLSQRNADSTVCEWLLSNIDLYQLMTIDLSVVKGVDDATTRSNIRSILEAIAQYGGIFVPLSHNTTQFTLHDWDILLTTLRDEYPEIIATDMDTAVDIIRNGGLWATADNRTYTRTFTDQSDYRLRYNSPAIDAGANTVLTTDILGNPIYGTPDIGAYEYQPPYTIGTDKIDITSPIRIYSDGKYRYTGSTSGGTEADLSVSPSTSWPADDYSQWMDIAVDTWNTSDTYYKKWTESSTGTLSVAHTVRDLKANTYYTIKVDGDRYNTYLSDDSGEISFTYTGGYSDHEFEVEEDTAPSASFNLSSPYDNTSTHDTTPTFSWNASPDSESGLAKYQLYIDGILDRDDISSSTTSVIPSQSLPCGSYTWYVKAVDNAGNSTRSNSTFTVNIVCGFTPGQPITKKPIPMMTATEIRAKITEITEAIFQLKLLLTEMDKTGKTSEGIPPDFTFDKNLEYGQTSDEIKYLQIILKQEVGPPTYPENVPATGWFGPVTKSSVIEFQDKYASEILAPWGLTEGTGFIGRTTLAKLNELLNR